jgi:hypothetical protein
MTAEYDEHEHGGAVDGADADVDDLLNAFQQVWHHARTHSREMRRIDDLIDLLEAQDTLFEQGVAALERRDYVTAEPLLSKAVQARIPGADWYLTRLMAEMSSPRPASVYRGASRHETPPPRIDSEGGRFVGAYLERRPDPSEAVTPAEFVDAMRRFHRWAGNPTYRKLSQRCGSAIPAHRFQAALAGSELPRFTILNAFILACGGSDAELKRWSNAWRRITEAQQEVAQVLEFPVGKDRKGDRGSFPASELRYSS